MEWTVVTVIIALLTLITGIITPIIKLNTTIAKLTSQMGSFIKGLEDFKVRYTNQIDEFKAAHTDLYSKIDGHEHRITKLESRHEKE